MYFIFITLQVLLMNWYIAKIVFGITAENKDTKQFDEQLRLIEAETQEEAFLKSRMIGLSEEDSFVNDKNKMVKWEFINVSELVPIKRLEDGVEVYSRIHEMEEAKSYVNFIHQKAMALRLNTMPLF
ncbi:protein of unknown function [Ohtaekwangia koreensis]|jgi:hypothetical protein|uniref:DUF4288 domain-containing protein n=2 Tax=Ohtaekwangia koreensis TaxID=688867 RepID=A0A1T5J0J7_9BACT|nr:protein of unknown function [Ohtaekwangia koreensis]